MSGQVSRRQKSNMMETDYYVVGNLRKDYEETYSKLASQWEKYAQRGYDIIDKVQKEGLLLVGINPSFDESFEGPCASIVRESENGGYQHPYFVKPRRLNDEIGISSLSHIDMFSIRTRHQKVVRNIINDDASQQFVEKQLTLFHRIINGTSPRAIVVINALASIIIKNALGNLKRDEDMGVDMYRIGEKQVPVFFSGMLSGGHPIDNGSYERLVWHIKYVLANLRTER